MQKGLSPIVAVVLLISISVIAAVGVYYWVGGLATKQPTPNAPIVIMAQSLNCTDSTTGEAFNVTALVQNLSPSETLSETLYLIADDGICENESAFSISSNTQESITFDCTGAVTYEVTRGSDYEVYAAGSGTAMITC